MANWIDKIIRDDMQIRTKYARMNREILQRITIGDNPKDKKETILYRNGARYFISVDGTPVATGVTKIDCAKKAFLNGHISENDYVSFTRGYAASLRYDRNKKKKKQLNKPNLVQKNGNPANVEYR